MSDGYVFHIDGPLSLFSATNKYGLQMALFLPALLLCRDFRLDAELRWGPKREPRSFHLEWRATASSRTRPTPALTSRPRSARSSNASARWRRPGT